MIYYLNTFKLKKPYSERYLAHQQVDLLMQERLSMRFAYSWSMAPHPVTMEHTLIQTSTSVPLNLPGEKQLTISPRTGDTIVFQCQFNGTIRITDPKDNRRKRDRVGTPDVVLDLFHKTALKNGFEATSVAIVKQSEAKIAKKNNHPFTLGLFDLVVTAKIIDPNAFEIAVVEGIGLKRTFGCGQIQFIDTQSES